MAMIRMAPIPVRVRTDWFDGRPRAVTWADQVLPVLGLAVVREEHAAYRSAVGPRTLFEVETPSARLALSYEHRTRRWLVEGLDEARPAA
ncbi:MAG TPA: hypothetical protein VF763_09465 [Candidatus Limnocylindrales bacterium]